MARGKIHQGGLSEFSSGQRRISPEVADEFEIIFSEEKDAIYARHGEDPALWTPESWANVQNMLEEMLLKAIARTEQKGMRASAAKPVANTLGHHN